MVTWERHDGRFMEVVTNSPIRARLPIVNAQTWVNFYPMVGPTRRIARLLIEVKVIQPWPR